jgi:L-threonylcarbamoyladenylate synthase
MADPLLTDDPARAVACLQRGGLVGLPTETVYGLAADAGNPDAVARIFAAKGRPTDHPLIVHGATAEMLDGWAAPAPRATAAFAELAGTCWPGPLTLLVERGPLVPDVVTGGRPTVGVRVPAHAVATHVLELLGHPVAAPSANLFGRVSPTTAEHVLADLAGVLDPARDCVLDGGRSTVGVESTIVDLTVDPPQVLRAGAIDADTIMRLLDAPVAAASGASRAAGMLTAHYAPRVEVLLVEAPDDAIEVAAAREGLGQWVQILDRTGDLVVAAHELYADLRAADTAGIDALVVVLPPPTGLGLALRDRLIKAAAGSAR